MYIEYPIRDGWELSDAASETGTFVNGSVIHTHKLKSGDILRLGKCEAVYQSADAPAQLAMRVGARHALAGQARPFRHEREPGREPLTGGDPVGQEVALLVGPPDLVVEGEARVAVQREGAQGLADQHLREHAQGVRAEPVAEARLRQQHAEARGERGMAGPVVEEAHLRA